MLETLPQYSVINYSWNVNEVGRQFNELEFCISNTVSYMLIYYLSIWQLTCLLAEVLLFPFLRNSGTERINKQRFFLHL